MEDSLIIPCLNCIKITQKQAWRPLIYFAWMKSMYFREYVCRFSRKLHYFCILGVSHLNGIYCQQYMCTSLRSYPSEWLKSSILNVHGLYMISMFTTCEIHLDGKNPHLTKLQISEWSTFDRRVKRSSIDPKEILTRWWSNMHRSEIAFCHKILSSWPGIGSWNVSDGMHNSE